MDGETPVTSSGSNPSRPDPRTGLVVGFVIRSYLARSETFVHNQMRTLTRYRPLVLAHQLRPHGDFALPDGAVARDLLPRQWSRLDALAYRSARQPLGAGIRLLADYARAQGTNLLHYHYLTDARFMLGLQRRLGLPSVVSGYGYDVSSFPRMGRGLGAHYLRPIFDRLDLFLAMSEDMRRDMLALGCPEEKVVLHYHGIDTRRFSWPERVYRDRARLNVLCCGRLVAAKGHVLVLEALRQITGRRQFTVTFMGEGPLREELERLTRTLGWQSRVTFLGHIPHDSQMLVDQFRRADVFVHPSMTTRGLKEGIPGTIVEAMACGLPVVATRHAGIPEVIRSGRDGLLVPEADAASLAGAIDSLFADPSLRRRLGEAAAQRAAGELDLQVRGRVLEGIYDRLVNHPVSSGGFA